MGRFPRRWWIAGGLAIDAFLGVETRTHSDIDVAVLRKDQRDLHSYLGGWALEKVVKGIRHASDPWFVGEWLGPDIEKVVARKQMDAFGAHVDAFLLDHTGADWVYSTEHSVHRSLADVSCRTADAVPFLCPEVILLYKAEHARESDEVDFRFVAGQLGAEPKAWLRGALQAVAPGHRWISAL